MKIKLLENILLNGVRSSAGEVIEVNQSVGKSLTADGLAKSMTVQRKKDDSVQGNVKA